MSKLIIILFFTVFFLNAVYAISADPCIKNRCKNTAISNYRANETYQNDLNEARQLGLALKTNLILSNIVITLLISLLKDANSVGGDTDLYRAIVT